jgi:hypothetical protein
MKRQAEYHFASDDENDYLDDALHLPTVTFAGVMAITGATQYSLLVLVSAYW